MTKGQRQKSNSPKKEENNKCFAKRVQQLQNLFLITLAGNSISPCLLAKAIFNRILLAGKLQILKLLVIKWDTKQFAGWK